MVTSLTHRVEAATDEPGQPVHPHGSRAPRRAPLLVAAALFATFALTTALLVS